MDDELINDYIEEVQDILARLTSLLDNISGVSFESDDIEELFRGIHTIKGGAGMFDWNNTKTIAHELEAFLGECRSEPSLFDYDRVRSEIDKIETLIENNDQAVGMELVQEGSKEDSFATQSEKCNTFNSLYFSRFFVDFDDFVRSQMKDGVRFFETLVPELVRDRFVSLVEGHDFQIIQELPYKGNLAILMNCSEVLIKKNYDFLARLYEFENFQEVICQHVEQEKKVEKKKESQKVAQDLIQATKEGTVEKSQTKKVDVLRVPLDKVNDALNSIWEIFLLRNQIAYLFEKNKPFLSKNTEMTQEWEVLDNALKRNIDELESTTMSMRMSNMTSLFSRMKKVVRSYQSQSQKDIEFIVLGEEIELDKKVLDMLGEPLIHLVRNAMDHGVEAPENREKVGKNSKGTIILSAESMSDKVVLSLKDDGKGIDPQKILTKAKEKGLDTDHLKSEQEIIELIFSPGFSTAEAVTDVSGRGVGMDAVKRSILKLGGEVFIESEVGVGSTFRIELPLSMAVVSSILFDVNGITYGSSINNLVEVCRDSETILKRNNDSVLFPYRGEFVECFDLRNHFSAHAGLRESDRKYKNDYATFCILEVNGRKSAIRVNKVTQHTDIVVKEMKGAFPSVNCLNGVSILATGKPIFVVSLTKIVRKFWEGGKRAA